MSRIVLIDTSVLLNILRVPGYDQNWESVRQQYEKHLDQEDNLLLPMATILETGSHIADIRNGAHRREWGQLFVDVVKKTYQRETPWQPLAFPTLATIVSWLDQFPDLVTEGKGLADVTIIKDWEQERDRHPLSRVIIWSLDKKLHGYDHKPRQH